MSTKINLTPFAQDVLHGLSSKPKKLSSKFFYDDEGSHIFQEIMEMPEYYLTNSELEILQEQPQQIIEALNHNEGFSIVELGAGDGSKTKEFLKYAVDQKIDITYYPVDISARAMELLEAELHAVLPNLKINPLVGDYFKVLHQIDLGEKPAMFMYLGSNIGNYEHQSAIKLLKLFGSYMRPGDDFLIGFDLKKNPRTILNAYDDPHGITRRFNLNLLKRINRELDANFELANFDFYAFYNPQNGQVRSYLVSLKAQEVWIGTLQKSFVFAANELIWTEVSKKYDLAEIKNMAVQSGFHFNKHFLDSKSYFADSLWRK